jgi:hypothetical protein
MTNQPERGVGELVEAVKDALVGLYHYTAEGHMERGRSEVYVDGLEALADLRARAERGERIEAALVGLMDALAVDFDGDMTGGLESWGPAWVRAVEAVALAPADEEGGG